MIILFTIWRTDKYSFNRLRVVGKYALFFKNRLKSIIDGIPANIVFIVSLWMINIENYQK